MVIIQLTGKMGTLSCFTTNIDKEAPKFQNKMKCMDKIDNATFNNPTNFRQYNSPPLPKRTQGSHMFLDPSLSP
jgi:hypothetical protein